MNILIIFYIKKKKCLNEKLYSKIIICRFAAFLKMAIQATSCVALTPALATIILRAFRRRK